MDDQLNAAPCGYLVMDAGLQVLEMNETLRSLLGIEKITHAHDLLTPASRAYFQTYFLPSIQVSGNINEMYLTLKGPAGRIPVLMNAVQRNGRYECVLLTMFVRQEYEQELLAAKRNAEKINREAAEANQQLQLLLQEVEGKQRELKKLNRELRHLSETDSLTGLKNRRYMDEQLHRLAQQSSAGGRFFSLLVLDIDRFKHINDTHGHPLGDAVLRELAWNMQRNTRKEDIVVRMGGEEFVVLLPGIGKTDASFAAEQLRHHLEHAPWAHVNITVSIGVAEYEPGEAPAALLARADQSLYRAKRGGRNQVAVG